MNIHRQIKRKRIEEGLWDDVKNKAKSLVGKGKKEFDAPSIIKLQSNGSFFRAMKDVLLFTKEEVMSGKSGNISFDFPRIYKENSENMYQYFNSLGISYNPKILDMWKKYGLEVKNFYKLFLNNPNKYNSNDILMEHKVFEYLDIKLPLINNDFGSNAIQDMLELLINDPIDRNSLNTYFKRKLSRYSNLDDNVTDIKGDASYIKEWDYRLETTFKYLLSFIKKKVKEQFDSLIYIPETIDAKKYSRIKDELYRFFKYFYPNDSIQEITKKLGISKKDNLYYNKDNLPTEDFMKSSMATKEKTLKNYLQKKLTISPKEAELIESVIKEYVKKKKKVKEVKKSQHKSNLYAPGAVVGGGILSDSITISTYLGVKRIITDFQQNKIKAEDVQEKIINEIDISEADMENHILYLDEILREYPSQKEKYNKEKKEYKQAFITGLEKSVNYIKKIIETETEEIFLYDSILEDIKERLTNEYSDMELIESVIKEYVKKKNKSSIKEYASFYIPLLDMMKSQKTEIKKFESLDDFIGRMENKLSNMNILHMYDSMRTKAPREYKLLNDEYEKLQTVKENFKRKTVKETSHDLDPEETSLSRTLLPSKYGRHPYSYEPSMEDEDIVSKEEEEEFYKRHPELKRRKKRK